MSFRGCFIAGTDTDVGKTWLAVRLIAEMRRRSVQCIGMKPVECGAYEDSEALHLASDEPELSREMVNPVHLDLPIAPIADATVPIDIPELVKNFENLAERFGTVVVEGAGGWLVPIDAERDFADLATALQLPVVIVAADRLGVINHTRLTLAAIERAGLPIAGIYLNRIQDDPTDPSQQSNLTSLRAVSEGVEVIDNDVEALCDRLLDLS
ncbi:MAG: dethiobiotin synthase [Verrucomicrobiota bacterium]